ncbi:MAG: autotransporter domain-containing protein [Endomicrobia bacterium]|nr:autotransporter domain-containing protein [Endomicrobiia bacterium]
MKRVFLIFLALFIVVFLAVNVYAVTVTYYNEFQTNLQVGNNVEIINSDIIKADTNALTIIVPSSLTITGNGRVINMASFGNMITISSPSVIVTMISATVRGGNYADSGGAISVTGADSVFNVDGVSSFGNILGGNFSSGNGGAIYAESNSSVVFSGSTTFQNNYANAGGGAIYLTDSASADFSGTALTALGNITNNGDGGFLSAVSAGTITFGTAMFTNNSATNGYGGVIFSSNSSINFIQDVSFVNNSAFAAGVMCSTAGSMVTFSGANTLFQGNQAEDSVAAVMVRNGSGITFQGETTVFKNNFMTNNAYGTGAIDIAYNSVGDFTNTMLIAQGNNAGNGGYGGFLWTRSSSVSFGNALIGGANAGDGNIAYYGGGVYAVDSANIVFKGTDTIFSNNISYLEGGGIAAAVNSTVTFNAVSNVSFQNNMANNKGGAAALTEASLLVIQGGSDFIDNSAALGGAISIEGGSSAEITNGSFTGNKASLAGGAVYVSGTNIRASEFRSYTTAAGDARTVFNGNEAQGIRNAIYLDDYGHAYFNADAGTAIEMFDGISGINNITTYFEFSGAGDFNLYGTFDTLNLNSSGNFNLMAGSEMNANTVNSAAGAKFNMQNGIADAARMITLNNSGLIAMDIISPTENDQIIISGQMNLSASSALDVRADSMTDENFRKRIYKLINYDSYTGSFTAVSVSAPITLTNAPELFYGIDYADWVTLSIRGSQSGTEFMNMKLDTFNQKEAAKALDKISETVVDHSLWDLVLSDIEAHDNDGIKNILSHLAGFFLPNIIRNAVADSPNNEIYDRIKNHCIEGHSVSNGLWVQARGGVETFYENENSIGDYKNISSGIMAGYDRYMEDVNLMLGIYGRYGADSIEQGRNKADGKRTGIGVYGGYIKQRWELKAINLISFDSFDTKRYVPYNGATAEAEIKTAALSFDFEGALKFDMSAYTKLRPYAGFEFANANYGNFKESGAGIFNLDVKSGNYVRSAGRAGAGLHYEKNIWNWYANLEGKLLLSGTEPEIENAFVGTSALFKTRGAKEGALEIGAGVGGAVRLTKSLKVFANANYYGADKYQNLFGNIGLRYTFCNTLSLKKYIPVYDPSIYETEPEPAKPAPVVMPKSEDIDMFNELGIEEQKLEAQKRREKPVLKSFSLNMANFDTGKAVLTEKAKEDIRVQAEEIKNLDFTKITIEGHTDSIGSGKLNKELSIERAKSVFDEFSRCGIPEEKMFYIGFGSEMSRDTNTTAKGRARNRRVEIFVE